MSVSKSPLSEGFVTGTEKAARKVEPWLQQGSDRTGDGLTYEFVLYEMGKDLAFFLLLDIYDGMRRLQVPQEYFFQLLKKRGSEFGCCMHKQARFSPRHTP